VFAGVRKFGSLTPATIDPIFGRNRFKCVGTGFVKRFLSPGSTFLHFAGRALSEILRGLQRRKAICNDPFDYFF
jgi:hypothetical protein